MSIDLCEKCPTLLNFLASWCGHCKSYKPLLQELQRDEKSKTIPFHMIHFDDVEHKQVMKEFGISGYPTLLVAIPPKLSGKSKYVVYQYQGQRTKEALLSTMNNVIHRKPHSMQVWATTPTYATL